MLWTESHAAPYGKRAHEAKKNKTKRGRHIRIFESDVERIIHDSFRMECKETLSYKAPLVLGVDKYINHKYKYAKTIKDL